MPELLINEGAEVLETIERFHADLTLISVQGLDRENGATVGHYQDGLVKKAFLEHSSELGVLAGKEKLGFSVHYKICDVSELDYLITDEDQGNLKKLKNSGFQIMSV